MENDTSHYAGNATHQRVARTLSAAPLYGEDVRTFMMYMLVVSGVTGMVCNIINIVVFANIKSKETINITLIGLAVSDFMICLTATAITLTGLPGVKEFAIQQMRWNPHHVFYLGIGLPHNVFTRVTILLTTLITFERCICVTFPLRVKTLFTRRRVKICVVLMYMIGFCVLGPNIKVNRLGMTYYPALNMSLLSQIQTEDFFDVYAWATPLNVIFFFVLLFLVIVVSTVILISNLRKAMMWRRQNAAVGTGKSTSTSRDNASTKETKIVMMVVILAIVFIICYLPTTVMILLVSFSSEFTLQGNGIYIIMLFTWVNYMLAIMNGNINIFVYYRNNSNYKEVFNRIFHVSSMTKS